MTDPMVEDGYDDEPEDDREPLRGKWVMDGAATLAEAAAKLRERANELDKLASEGWTLDGSVNDDWGFLVPPEGYKR